MSNTLKDKLVQYYNDEGCQIRITSDDIPNLTLEDIFTIIYLMYYKNYWLCIPDDEMQLLMDNYIQFAEGDNNKDIRAILLIIKYGPCDEGIWVGNIHDDDVEYIYEEKDKFIKLAEQFNVLHLMIVQNIMECLEIEYDFDQSGITQLAVEHYLGVSRHIKSARNI